MLRKIYIKPVFAIAALVLFASNAFAFKPYSSQKNDTHSPVFKLAPTAPNAPTSAPFDGGITLLIAAGVGYASKKGFDKRRKQAEKIVK